jgi:threonine synthase
MKFVCFYCNKEKAGLAIRCDCGGFFRPVYDFKFRSRLLFNFPYIKRWVSLGETVTPILRYGKYTLKLEYFSPTFSYKDRGTKTLISYLAANIPPGSRVNEDSSGNAGASISAYASFAGLKPNIFVPEEAKEAKISQIRAYGARIHLVQGSREKVMDECLKAPGILASHVLRPEFRDGIRLIPYEFMRQNGWKVPSSVVVPVSAGTLLLGVVYGFEHLYESGEIQKVPEIIAAQTEYVSPLYHRLLGKEYFPPGKYESVADALVSQNPPLLDEMEEKVRRYGRSVLVKEEEITENMQVLAKSGILVEYSSAVAMAAARKIKDDNPLVIMTGNGLKSMPFRTSFR